MVRSRLKILAIFARGASAWTLSSRATRQIFASRARGASLADRGQVVGVLKRVGITGRAAAFGVSTAAGLFLSRLALTPKRCASHAFVFQMRSIEEEGASLAALARAAADGVGSDQFVAAATRVPRQACGRLVVAWLVGLGIAHRARAWSNTGVTKPGASWAYSLSFAS